MPKTEKKEEYNEIDVREVFNGVIKGLIDTGDKIICKVEADINGVNFPFEYTIDKGLIGNYFVPNSRGKVFKEKYGIFPPEIGMTVDVKFTIKGNPIIVLFERKE